MLLQKDKNSLAILKNMNAQVLTGTAYQEVIDFLARGTTPEAIANFQVSEDVKERVIDLIYQEKNETLSSDEKSELDHYLLLEHLVRLAKARAYQYMTENKADATSSSPPLRGVRGDKFLYF